MSFIQKICHKHVAHVCAILKMASASLPLNVVVDFVFSVCVCVRVFPAAPRPSQLHLNSIERDAYEVVKGPTPHRGLESPTQLLLRIPIVGNIVTSSKIIAGNTKGRRRRNRTKQNWGREWIEEEMGIDFQFSRLPRRKHHRASLSLRLTWRILNYN